MRTKFDLEMIEGALATVQELKTILGIFDGRSPGQKSILSYGLFWGMNYLLVIDESHGYLTTGYTECTKVIIQEKKNL